MSWNAKNAATSCARISSLLESPDCTLLQLVKDDGFLLGLKRQMPKLMDFVINHIEEFIQIALALTENDNPALQRTCFQAVVQAQTQSQASQSFADRLIDSPQLLNFLNQFLLSDNFSKNSSAAFQRIFQFLIQASEFELLPNFPESNTLFTKLLKHTNHTAILLLLEFITEKSGEALVSAFLESNKATEVLLNKIFQSTNEAQNEKLYLLLTNIILGIGQDSSLLSPFEDSTIMGKIFQKIVTNTCPHTAARAINFWYELTAIFDNDEDLSDDPLYDAVYGMILRKIPEICEFIGSSKPFLADKFMAVELINTLVVQKNEITQPFKDMIKKLFDQVLEYPAHTIMHRCFLSLFNTLIVQDETGCLEIINEANMRQRIIAAFEQRNKIAASYWGILYNMSNKIIDHFREQTESDANWTLFCNTVIYEMKETIARTYGGFVPPMPTSEEEEEPPGDDLKFPMGNSQLAAMNSVVTMTPAKIAAEARHNDED